MLYSPQPSIAYVDGSALLSIIFEESAGPAMALRLAQFTTLVSSILLEAEVRAAMFRARLDYDPRWLSDIAWIFPTSSLGPEISDALRARYLRSGDLLHVATALYYARINSVEMAFITLDNNQREAAASLGFAT